MHLRMLIIQCKLLYCPEELMVRAGSHSVLQSFRFCHLLAASLTKFSAVDCGPEVPLQLHGVRHLSALTKLTEVALIDNAAVGNLTELKHLRQLHTLYLTRCVEGPLRASSLTNIQKLTLNMGTAQTVNLSCCTQLTFLSFEDICSRLQTVTLPQGDSVQLRDLHMTGCADINPLLVMSNLSCASRLAILEITSVYPSNLRQGDWPLCMPELRVVALRQLDCQLPQQLCKYPNLRDLNLWGLVRSDLPGWFAELTQITSLLLSCSKFTAFPAAIIQLSQLCTLCIKDIEPPMVIGPDITSITKWKRLRVIDLTADGYSLDSQLYLLEVYYQLKSAGVQIVLSAGP